MNTFAVAGASGSVGEGIVAELLSQGFNVVAIVRSRLKSDALRSYLNQIGIETQSLVCLINKFQSEDEIAELKEDLSNHGIDTAIASLGGWYHGKKLYQMPADDIKNAVNGGLFAHLHFAKAAISALKEHSGRNYIMINGGASEHVVPHSGIISIVAAAQKMMTAVLAEELKDSPIRVHAVAAFDLVKTRERAGNDAFWLSPKEITRYILDLIRSSDTETYWHKLQKSEDLRRYN